MRINVRVIAIISILIFSILNNAFPSQIYSNDSIADSADVIDDSIFNQVEKSQIIQNLNKLDGFFTENRGQIENDFVRYYIQGKGVWFLDDGVVFEIREEISMESQESRVESRESEFPFDPVARLEPQVLAKYKSVVLKLNFENAHQVIPEGRGLLSHRSNFFYGNDSSKWQTEVPNYQEIFYENIYDNIDLRYYTTTNGLKYDFIVHPGGNPNNIMLSYEGAQDLIIDNSKTLAVKTLLRNIVDTDLLIYQNIENDRKIIEGTFNLLTHLTYGFKLFGEYDKQKELIIDPLIYSTYIGGSFYDIGGSIKIDSSGSIYITGCTESTNFPNITGAYDPTFNGDYDVFVLKLISTGTSLFYSTFIGGNELDSGVSIAIDTIGNAYVGGITESQNFPKTTGAYDTIQNGQTDIFILKLNKFGASLIYSTFIGGTNNEVTYSITLDSNGCVYSAGYTHSNDFPYTIDAYDTTYNGDWDVFVIKLNSSGSSLMYSTFLGGIDRDIGLGIVIDFYFNVYLTGYTRSLDFPITSNAYDTSFNGGEDDVFVVKLNLINSSLIYSSYFGGSDLDRGWDITIDSNCNIYVTGTTLSADFPNTTGVYDNSYNGDNSNEWWKGGDVLVLKLYSTNLSLAYSTYIGGSDYELGRCITIDSNNNAYVTGETKSSNFPNTTGAIDTINNGEVDVFVFKLNPVGSSLIYSTFIGGSNWDWGWDIAIDDKENIYVSGGTNSTNFPNTTNAYDNTLNGDEDVFVLKFNITINASLPSIIDLKISRPSILRTNSVHLYSNATDIEDREQNLTPIFIEYRDPNELIWNGTYFSNRKYNNSRWEVSFTPPKNAILGLYDFRVMFNDTDKLFSRWFYLNDSLMVLNNIPNILDMLLSKNTSLQNETIFVWVNGTDIEDDERNLTVELEYRDPNEQYWDNIYSIEPKYVNNSLEINFTIPFGSSFGYYDFRVRVNDSDGDYSQWLYANDSLLIYNDHPKVIDIELSNNSVYRTNSIFLYVNSTDHETEEAMLTFYAQYKPESETEWTNIAGKYSQSNARWETEFITNKDTTLGLYDFRVRFEDNETASTAWVYLNDSLEVMNNAPMISTELDDISVGISPILIDLSQYGSDIEDSVDTLIWMVNKTKEYSYLESLMIIKNDTLKIVPFLNVSGHVDIELTLKDKDGGTTTKSDITILINSLLTELTPKVTLLSPSNGSVVRTLTPTLEWKLDYSGDEVITYNIFLDKAIKPERLIKSNISMSSYTLETELENTTTYYWQVIPNGGVCLSKPFCFTINLSYKPDYKVNLTSEKNYIMLYPGLSTKINLTIRNEGRLIDSYEIGHSSNELQSHAFINKVIVQLSPGTESILKLTIMIPEDFEFGVYLVSIVAKSLNDATVSDEKIITIEVVKKDFIPDYRVSISVSPEVIEIEQGKTSNVTLCIINFGNIADKYSVSFISDVFSSSNIFLERNSVSLNESKIKSINVHISVLESTGIGSYNITFIVQSEYAANESTLTVHVEPKEASSEPTHEGENTLIFVIAGIIILIIILIVFILLRKRLKKTKQVTMPTETTSIESDEIAPSETTSLPAETSDKPPTLQPENQISISTITPETPVSIPTLSSSAPTQTPTLESKSGQISAPLRAIQPPNTQQLTLATAQQPRLMPKQPQAQVTPEPQPQPKAQLTSTTQPQDGLSAKINTIIQRYNNK